MFPKTTSSHEVQRNYRKVFDDVMKTREPTVVLNNNKPQVVIVDLRQYEAMLKRMEEYELALAMEAVRVGRKEKKRGQLKKLKTLADLV